MSEQKDKKDLNKIFNTLSHKRLEALMKREQFLETFYKHYEELILKTANRLILLKIEQKKNINSFKNTHRELREEFQIHFSIKNNQFMQKTKKLLPLYIKWIGNRIKFYEHTIDDIIKFNKHSGKFYFFNKKGNFSKEELKFLINHNINIQDLSSRWAWIDINPHLMKKFFYEIIYPKFNCIPNAQEVRKIGYRSFLRKYREYGGVWTDVKKLGIFSIPDSRERQQKTTWREFSKDEIKFFKKYNIKRLCFINLSSLFNFL